MAWWRMATVGVFVPKARAACADILTALEANMVIAC